MPSALAISPAAAPIVSLPRLVSAAPIAAILSALLLRLDVRTFLGSALLLGSSDIRTLLGRGLLLGASDRRTLLRSRPLLGASDRRPFLRSSLLLGTSDVRAFLRRRLLLPSDIRALLRSGLLGANDRAFPPSLVGASSGYGFAPIELAGPARGGDGRLSVIGGCQQFAV